MSICKSNIKKTLYESDYIEDLLYMHGLVVLVDF